MSKFIKELPEWNEPGIEPPQSKKDKGWEEGDKPPAPWHNWLLYKTYEALKELQNNAMHKDGGIDLTEIEEKLEGIEKNLGDLNDLTTDEKDNLVKAINELRESLTTHLADDAKHITASERSKWNKKQDELTISDSTSSSSKTTVANSYAIKQVMDRADEAFTLGNSTKQELVDTLLSLDDSLPITYENSWLDILTMMGDGTFSTGKKWAIGEVSVMKPAGESELTISDFDLTFRPSVILFYKKYDGKGNRPNVLYGAIVEGSNISTALSARESMAVVDSNIVDVDFSLRDNGFSITTFMRSDYLVGSVVWHAYE